MINFSMLAGFAPYNDGAEVVPPLMVLRGQTLEVVLPLPIHGFQHVHTHSHWVHVYRLVTMSIKKQPFRLVLI